MSNILGLLDKYKNVQDERFFDDVFVRKEYEAVFDKKADIVFDIGACAGEFSAYMYEKARTIYAFEPYEPHYTELFTNISEFDLTKIKPYHLALSDTNGSQHFSNDAGRGGNHLVERIEDSLEVKTMTLASFVKEHKIAYIDILKIDIEGDEVKVFGSSDFPQVAPLIKCIIGEHLYGGVHDILVANGFNKIVLPGNANTLYETANNSHL